MRQHTVTRSIVGPWSLSTSKRFWEGFAPAALIAQGESTELSTVFIAEADWRRVETSVTQHGETASITVRGDGDLDAAVAQVSRFLSLDVDATLWPEVGRRDPVIAEAQARLPGFRPCGFHSPYEAAAWAVLSQRIRVSQAAVLRAAIIRDHGEDGAFPPPQRLASLQLELPGRKAEYLHAVAEAAIDGVLDAVALRALPADDAIQRVQTVKGLGPFAAELVVIRGANAPDAMPTHEARLEAEIAARYGPDSDPLHVAEAWRPFRSWAAVHLRALRAA